MGLIFTRLDPLCHVYLVLFVFLVELKKGNLHNEKRFTHRKQYRRDGFSVFRLVENSTTASYVGGHQPLQEDASTTCAALHGAWGDLSFSQFRTPWTFLCSRPI